MKKLAILIAAVSLLALTGCGGKAEAHVSEAETTAETTTLSDEERLAKMQANYLKRLALTASELPAEALDIPDDWAKLTVNGVTVRILLKMQRTARLIASSAVTSRAMLTSTRTMRSI